VTQGELDLDGGWHAGPLFVANKVRSAKRNSTRMHGVWRRLYERRATPKWADRSAIAAMYRLARKLTAETGVRHSVDHVYPLVHELVCGLHSHHNMQILTLEENLKKGNYWFEGGPGEQLLLLEGTP